MSELSLIKMPLYVTNDYLRGRSVIAEQIVGITPPDDATIAEYGHTFDGSEQEERLELPDSAIDNLVEFYKQTRARTPDDRPDYSCHTFVYFVLGKTATVGLTKVFYTADVSRQWRINHLTAGQAYMAKNRAGTYSHNLLGVNRPAFNLSVDGDRMPLRITANRDILSLYGAKTLASYTPLYMTFHE